MIKWTEWKWNWIHEGFNTYKDNQSMFAKSHASHQWRYVGTQKKNIIRCSFGVFIVFHEFNCFTCKNLSLYLFLRAKTPRLIVSQRYHKVQGNTAFVRITLFCCFTENNYCFFFCSFCKFGSKGLLTSSLSDSICTEVNVSCFYYILRATPLWCCYVQVCLFVCFSWRTLRNQQKRRIIFTTGQKFPQRMKQVSDLPFLGGNSSYKSNISQSLTRITNLNMKKKTVVLGEISMSVITGWSFDNDEEDRTTGEKSVSMEQDPLGSSVVPPACS